MREQQTQTFSPHDGVELFYRHWPAGALALLHKQAWLFGAQVLLTLAAIFTSFWLRFCG